MVQKMMMWCLVLFSFLLIFACEEDDGDDENIVHHGSDADSDADADSDSDADSDGDADAVTCDESIPENEWNQSCRSNSDCACNQACIFVDQNLLTESYDPSIGYCSPKCTEWLEEDSACPDTSEFEGVSYPGTVLCALNTGSAYFCAIFCWANFNCPYGMACVGIKGDDFGVCAGPQAVCDGDCSRLLYNECTCGSDDPCGRVGNGICDSACYEFSGHLVDDLDCN